MEIAVIGTGIIGRTLAGRLATAGEDVTIGVRDAGGQGAAAAREALGDAVRIVPIADALARAGAVVVAIPGAQVPAFAGAHGTALAGRVVIDASNDTSAGQGGALHHLDDWARLAPHARVARAFCSVGWEVFADPVFEGTVASLPWCGPDGEDGEVVEHVIRAVGLDPVCIGGAEAAGVLDGVARLWFQLVFAQGLGRQVAVRILRRG